MTTRRSFFRQLALSVAAISSAQILIPHAADAFKWKRTGQWLIVPNPEYIDAPLEMAVIATMNTSSLAGKVWYLRNGPTDTLSEAKEWHPPIRSRVYPYRYDITGTRLIPPFIKKFVTEPVYSL